MDLKPEERDFELEIKLLVTGQPCTANSTDASAVLHSSRPLHCPLMSLLLLAWLCNLTNSFWTKEKEKGGAAAQDLKILVVLKGCFCSIFVPALESLYEGGGVARGN